MRVSREGVEDAGFQKREFKVYGLKRGFMVQGFKRQSLGCRVSRESLGLEFSSASQRFLGAGFQETEIGV